MRRLLMLMIFVAALRAQPIPYFTGRRPNGLMWRVLPSQEKTSYLGGVLDGYALARRDMQTACQGSVLASRPRWLKSTGTRDEVSSEVSREMDRFYEDGSNVSIPMIYAFVWSRMMVAGATKEELDAFRGRALQNPKYWPSPATVH